MGELLKERRRMIVVALLLFLSSFGTAHHYDEDRAWNWPGFSHHSYSRFHHHSFGYHPLLGHLHRDDTGYADHPSSPFARVGGFNVPYDEDEDRMTHHWTGLTHTSLRKLLRTEQNAEEALLNIQRRGRSVDQLTSQMSTESNPIRRIRMKHELRDQARWLEAYLRFFKVNFPLDHHHRTKEFNVRYLKTLRQHRRRRHNIFYKQAVIG